MRGFVRVGENYVASLDRVERAILAGVVADTALLLGEVLDDADAARGRAPADVPEVTRDPFARLAWPTTATPPPTDPALARLLPAANREDEDAATEFRRLTETDLRRRKVENLRLVWAGLRGRAGKLAVPCSAASAWAAALTDVRLVLAVRLGIETDEDAERVHEVAQEAVDPGALDGGADPEAEMRAALATLYAAMTWFQESLLQVMLTDAGA